MPFAATRCTDKHLSDTALLLRRSWHLFRMVKSCRLPRLQWACPSAGLDELMTVY